MQKHKAPVSSPLRKFLFIIAAGFLGILLAQTAISLNTSHTMHTLVVGVFWSVDCQPMPCSLDLRPEHWLSPFLIIGIGFAYGGIQAWLFRQFFHLYWLCWTMWTGIGTILGFLLLVAWETIYSNWIFPRIYRTPQVALFFDHFSPWFTFWLIFLSLPIGIVQAFRLHQRYKYAWVWGMIHPIGSLLYGLIAHPNSYVIPLQIYPLVFVLGMALALCFIWLMRHPHEPELNISR